MKTRNHPLRRVDDDDAINFTRGPNLKPLLREPDTPITVGRHELLEALQDADAALDGDSNDAEHDALYTLREQLAGWLEDSVRQATGKGKRR